MALITLEQATTHLRLSGQEYADDVELKMAIAEALVLEYLKIDADALTEYGWTAETASSSDRLLAITRGAILEVLANLLADRGDREKPLDGPLTERIKNQLSMQRDPTIA